MSCEFNAIPLRWAPTTTRATSPTRNAAESTGSPSNVAATSANASSLHAGPISWTPNGKPSGRAPTGTAIAARSSRFVNVVNVPIHAFTEIGSAATSASDAVPGVVGSNSESTWSQVGNVNARSSANRYSPRYASTADNVFPPRMIEPTVGSTPSLIEAPSRYGPTAAVRSATNVPP